MKFHPYSEIFRLLKGAEFDALVEDIRTNGLNEKIWLYQGKILDGRNRFLACEKAGIKPLFRKYTGKDALAFVWSANQHRRHDNDGERAMAAAKMATLRDGQRKSGASREAAEITQDEAAKTANVSRSSVQRARKILDRGSKALQEAVRDGDVPIKKAAAVVDLPKSEQLAAAKAKPKPVDDEPERPDWEPDEDEKLAAIEREIAESTERVMRSDDKLAAAHIEIKRQAEEIVGLKSSRDHYQAAAGVAARLVKSRDRQIEKLERDLHKAQAENESLKERVAIMETAA